DRRAEQPPLAAATWATARCGCSGAWAPSPRDRRNDVVAYDYADCTPGCEGGGPQSGDDPPLDPQRPPPVPKGRHPAHRRRGRARGAPRRRVRDAAPPAGVGRRAPRELGTRDPALTPRPLVSLVLDARVVLPACRVEDGCRVLRDPELIAPPLLWSEARSALHETLWRGE